MAKDPAKFANSGLCFWPRAHLEGDSKPLPPFPFLAMNRPASAQLLTPQETVPPVGSTKEPSNPNFVHPPVVS